MKGLRFFPALVLLFATAAATAQSIPVDIPDTPGESPADREREHHEERFRPILSRMYATTAATASPLINHAGIVFDTFVEGGLTVNGGDAVFFTVGSRFAPDFLDDERSSPGAPDRAVHGGVIFALGLEHNLTRYTGVENWALALSVGGWSGETDIMYAEMSPRYLLKLNSYWTVPLGIKVGAAVIGESSGSLLFVGPTIGLRHHFGQPRYFE